MRCARIFGEYRAPTGVARAAGVSDGRLEAARREVEAVSRQLGRRLKMLVGKPGLDGHSNGAEQIAVARPRLRHGSRLRGHPPHARAHRQRRPRGERARRRPLDPVGLAHVSLVGDVLDRLRAAGIGDIPVVVGGIIPPADAEALIKAGVARVYTPKDFDLTAIMRDIVSVVAETSKKAA